MKKYTISTAKGSFASNDLTKVVEWQCRMQGSFANINGVNVDDIDFDDDEIDETIEAVTVAVDGLNGVKIGDWYDHPEGGCEVIGLDREAGVLVCTGSPNEGGDNATIPWPAFEPRYLVSND